MKRYLLSYLAAYVASLAAFGVIMVIAISNWFFTDSPLWFDVLGVIVTALPALALGEVLGRRFKAKQAGIPLVPSRFMRKIVCRLRLNEVSRQ